MTGFNVPSGLYTGGAVVLDSQPLASLYHQHTMKAQARDEALDDYFRNLNKSINPAGVRNQDIDGLTKKQQEWQQFYQQNKQAIKNPRIDNGKSYTEYQSRLQDMHNYVQQSKNATAVSDDLAKARLNPNMGYVFDDDEIINKIATHDKPLTDPTRKDINIQQLSIQPKPYDAKELGALQKSAAYGLKPSETVEDIKVDPKTFDTITTTKKNYSNEDLQTYGNRYKQMYQMDRRLRSVADKNLFSDPNATKYNDAYKNAYGKNAETTADLLAGQAIMNMQTEGTFEKRTPGSLEQKKFLESLKQKGRKELVELRYQKKQMEKAQEGVWLDEYMDRFVKDAEESPKSRSRDAKGNVVEEAQIPLDRILAQAFTKQVGSQKVEPDAVKIMSNGKIRPVYYKYGKDGKPEKSKDGWFVEDEILSQPIGREQLKLNISKLTQSAKQRAAEMGGEQSSGSTTTQKEDLRTKYNY